MKSKFKKNLIAATAVLALSCVAAGGVLALNTSDGLVDTTAHKTASLVAAAETTTPTSTGGTTYYVSPTGTSMAAGTESDPKDISSVLTSTDLGAGDVIMVMPGTYTIDAGIIATASGAYNNYITVKNASTTEKAVLSFYDMKFLSTNRGVQIYGDYWYWYDVDICGAGDNGMYIGGSYNIIENSEFYNNRDTGLQLGRAYSTYSSIQDWPSYNLIKNCTSYNNYDNETYGENADGFAAKLTVGYGNIFDGCIAYRNSDDGWDLYAKADTGNIGCVIIYNCVAFENGYLMESQATCNARYANYDTSYNEGDTSAYTTRDGDGNGFKLGGGVNEGDVILYNCMAFNNRMHGVTDNSNPGTLQITGVTSYNNGVNIGSTGAIDYSVSVDEDNKCANIDVARWDYSYNVLSDVLSVIDDGAATSADAYRGSVESSMFSKYYITDNIDAYDSDSTKCGTAYDATYSKPTKALFTATPLLTMGTDCGTYDSTTHTYDSSKSIHAKYRNSDGSINMGDILAISDYTGLVSDSIGCVLNGTSWSSYTHYDYTVLTDCSSQAEADATSMAHLIYVPINVDACYQDFKVVASMYGYDITWTSSDEDVLSVASVTDTTTSGSESFYVTVYRDATEDKEVTLTASITVSGVTKTKTFEITVVQDDPTIGDITVNGVGDSGVIMVDQYSMYPEPGVKIENGSDYNGKLLDDSLYTLSATYMYATTKDSDYYQVGMFTPSKAGVYVITYTATINGSDGSGNKSGSCSYTVYVASTTAQVTLVSSSVTVYRDGFILEAEPSSVTGNLYVYVSDTEVTDITSEYVVANGEKTAFRTDAISLQYENDNTAGYYIYYVVTNVAETYTSEVYSKTIATAEISTTSDFNAMLASSNTTTIYVLKNDINYGTTAEDNTITLGSVGSSSTFSGLLNGMGYTVKNIAATNYVISKVQNGTIMNIKFDNITITSAATKTGIIGEMDGGYIYNVAMTNIAVSSSAARTGALIGQIGTIGTTNTVTYIQNVSLVNDSSHTLVGTERVGGIVGFYQDNASQAASAEIYISDCYVNAKMTVSSAAVGGIVGRFDDRNANDYLSITNCVVAGSLTCTGSSSRIGGMLGYQSGGNGTLYISNCVNLADIVFGGETLIAAIKNASGMVGNYSTAATVTVRNCYALFEDYNSEYAVTAYSTAALQSANWWTKTVGLDTTTAWSISYDTDGSTVISPYVTLNYLS